MQEGMMKSIVRINMSLWIILLCVFAFHKPLLALSCGKFDHPKCDGPDLQYAGGDADGVGHFKARNNTGQIIYEMLNTDCTDMACKGSYTGGPVKAGPE
jgi:hypothetical protein